jgi:hypothetical protein
MVCDSLHLGQLVQINTWDADKDRHALAAKEALD